MLLHSCLLSAIDPDLMLFTTRAASPGLKLMYVLLEERTVEEGLLRSSHRR
jgi:hypothetical protein